MTEEYKSIIEECTYLPKENQKHVLVAYDLAEKFYSNCVCHRGSSCLDFVMSVLTLLLPRTPDAHTIITCLLQCARKPEHLNKIEKQFGKGIRSTVATLAMLEGECGTMPRRSSEQLKRMLIAFSGDIRVLLIVLHNCLHLLKCKRCMEEKGCQLLAREVLGVFAPLCARLGIYALKYQLESLAFSLLYGENAQELEVIVTTIQKKHRIHLENGREEIQKLLVDRNISSTTESRIKHPYSIFQKMQRKNVTHPTDLYDLFGIRILVNSEEDCYRTLGIIHRHFRPLAHRMKDYIAMPKPNGYRSLHTTVLGISKKDSSLPLEVQIRTHAMQEEAEYGIAAHWNYKEEGSVNIARQKSWNKQLLALREWSADEENEEGEDMEEELSDRIFVLTPKGNVIELRKGATPLDFAFRIHTDVGIRYRHAIVNSIIMPINHTLENGDVVEIQTWNLPRASEQWSNIVKTKNARQKLRAYFREIRGKKTILQKTTIHRKNESKFLHQSQADHVTQVHLESDTELPYCFAKCCQPNIQSAKNPPIIGCITRNGMIRIHYAGCRMITDANSERLIKANWATAGAIVQ